MEITFLEKNRSDKTRINTSFSNNNVLVIKYYSEDLNKSKDVICND